MAPGPDGPRPAPGRRPLTVAACLGAILLLYVAYLGQSRSVGTDADGASNVLQAWDMLHGNLLLRGWWLSDVSFYTTELPEYMLVELARGLNPGVINAAGAATYTLLVALAALLAKGRATGTAGLLRVLIAAGIMLAPGPGFSASSLLSSPDHTGTVVPLLLIWLAIDRLEDRWYLPWLVGALLTWVEVADQLAVYVGALPVIVVSAIRIYRRRESWRVDAGLLAAAAASIVLAKAVLLLIRLAGGFVVAPVSTGFAAPAQIPHHLWLTFESVLTLFGADFIGLRSWPAVAVAVLHLTGVILAAWACCIAGRRLLAADERLVALLFVGIVIDLAAYVVSTQAFDLGSTHELAAVLPFGAVLAGRLIPGRLIPGRPLTRALLPALLAVLAGYAGVLAYHAVRLSATADDPGRGVVVDGQSPGLRDWHLLDRQHHDRRDQRPGRGTPGLSLLWPLLPLCLGVQAVVVCATEQPDVPRARAHRRGRGGWRRCPGRRPVRLPAADRADWRL